ncbi:DUF397 domain-containing protein [Streptomyces sp. NBC_01190]|uniref:DUF397 domain-containing protein n=1 Tax=Streptomyces sp. NBC_01190 TaxID=2903767 RepID=UPI0038689C97|nr:DUF397 domain-containing protein [Streptomyces sp. NBC_01190]
MGAGQRSLRHGWRRSSFCGNELECVEVSVKDSQVLARDSKDPHGAVLVFPAATWKDFLQALGAGRLDGS